MDILVVDDHPLIRAALCSVFHELDGSGLVAQAGSVREAMDFIGMHPTLDLVTVDLALPDGDGLDFLARLRERCPAICVVVLSAHHDRDTVTEALEAGALGFISKSASREVMLSAFRFIFAGGVYVPPEAFSRAPQPPQPPTVAASCAPPPGLTPRQLEVLALMMEGKSNKAICRILDLAEPTVKNHVTAILKVIKAKNRTEAVIIAGRIGLGASKTSA